MVPPTRRRLLQVAAATAGSLAGCSGLTGTGESTNSETAGMRDDPDGNRETDPPAVVRRAATERPPIVLGSRETETADSERLSPRVRSNHAVIDSRSEAERLNVAPGIDSEEVTAFVDETAFDEATLYLETRRVEACFRLQLCDVRWQPDEVDTSYVRQIRPWDEACEAEQYVTESRLVRIPAALDADEVHGYGSSVSSGGSCEDRRVVARSVGGSSSGSDAGSGGSDR